MSLLYGKTFDVYLDECCKKHKTIQQRLKYFIKMHNDFGFDSMESFERHVNFYLEHFLSNVKFLSKKEERPLQSKFRKNILCAYNNMCIVSGVTCEEELEACHIKSVIDGGSYTENNGLLLTRNLHSTFDHHLWSINPETFIVEVLKNHNDGTINKYRGKKINIKKNKELIENLRFRYDLFLKNSQKIE